MYVIVHLYTCMQGLQGQELLPCLLPVAKIFKVRNVLHSSYVQCHVFYVCYLCNYLVDLCESPLPLKTVRGEAGVCVCVSIVSIVSYGSRWDFQSIHPLAETGRYH